MIESFSEYTNHQVKIAASKTATRPDSEVTPTREQLIAGEYTKGQVLFNGLPIEIENPAGSIRSGEDWMNQMFNHYGYIGGTMGADGDPLDVFLGDAQYDKFVTIIDQYVDGEFDEHKIMIGFPDHDVAVNNYFMNYDSSWPRENCVPSTITVDQLKTWLMNSDTTKPYKG